MEEAKDATMDLREGDLDLLIILTKEEEGNNL